MCSFISENLCDAHNWDGNAGYGQNRYRNREQRSVENMRWNQRDGRRGDRYRQSRSDGRNRGQRNRQVADLDPKDLYWAWYNQYLDQVDNRDFYDIPTTLNYKVAKDPGYDDPNSASYMLPGQAEGSLYDFKDIVLPENQPTSTSGALGFIDGADVYNMEPPNNDFAGAGDHYAVDTMPDDWTNVDYGPPPPPTPAAAQVLVGAMPTTQVQTIIYQMPTPHQALVLAMPAPVQAILVQRPTPALETYFAAPTAQQTVLLKESAGGASYVNVGEVPAAPGAEAEAGSGVGIGGAVGVDADTGASEIDGSETPPQGAIDEAIPPSSNEVPLVPVPVPGAGAGAGAAGPTQSASPSKYPAYALTRENRFRFACPASARSSVSALWGRERKLAAYAPAPRAHLRGKSRLLIGLKKAPDESAAAPLVPPLAAEGAAPLPPGPVTELPTMVPAEVEVLPVEDASAGRQSESARAGTGIEGSQKQPMQPVEDADHSIGKSWEGLPSESEFPFGWGGGRRR